MKLQLKRSNVLELGAAKEPTAPQMEYGELAVNYNTGDPAIFLKDSNDNIIRIAGTGNINSGDNPSGDTLPPTGNDIGDMFFNTTNNTMYYWDGSEWVPIANDVTAADIFVGTLAEINAEVPEDDRRNGFLWWNVEDGTLYIWYIDANTSQFVIAIPSTGGGGGSGASVVVLDTPPTDPEQGDMWWNTIDGRLYIWYQDVDSGQWVDASPDSQVSPITSGPVFPADALENDCFFNTTDGRLYIYYDDGTSLQWVDASPDSQGAVYWNRVNGELVPTSDTDNVNIGDGNIVLNADGIGSFTDLVKVAGTLRADRTGGNQSCIEAMLNNVANARIFADGSAEFAGSVQSGDDPNNEAEEGVLLNSIGLVKIRRDDLKQAFLIHKTGQSDATVSFRTDGSATFAGDVRVGSAYNESIIKAGTGVDSPTRMTLNGALSSSGSNIAAFSVRKWQDLSGTGDGPVTCQVNYDGSAIFAGGNVELNSTGSLWCRNTFKVFNGNATPSTINLDPDGSATFTGTVTATVVPPSDARFKENITPAKPQLADVVALGGLLKNYDWNDDAPVNDELQAQRQLGLIAQEAEEVCPSIVKDIHRTKTVEVTPAVTGPKGRVLTEAVTQEVDDSYKGISQDALIMKLIGAVAELSAEVQSLKEGN